MNSFNWKSVLLLALPLVISGCGSGGPSLYKAGGTVTFKGQPVSDATVNFLYADGSAATGVTDAAGKFSLAYSGNPKGAAVGKCSVSVTKIASTISTTGGSVDSSKDPAAMMNMMKKFDEAKKAKEASGEKTSKNDLPAKYEDPKKSGLSFEVTTDPLKNDFSIVLTE
ncbi:MAG: hypothetical protein ACKVP0_08915 [Pirellulaceae bacterium]